jgi:hypothetical protein
MTLRITYALALLSGALEAAAQGIQQTQFNQVINLNGDVCSLGKWSLLC